MPELDFSNASPDDFNVGGSEVSTESVAPATEQKPVENVEESISVSSQPQVSQDIQNKSVEEPLYRENQSFEDDRYEERVQRKHNFKDDFIKGVVDYYERTGDLTPYLQAKIIDFNKISDEEIMRVNLRDQYSNLSDKAFDRLYKQQIVDKYKLDADEYGEEDYELGKELLSAEAAKVRQAYVEWQNNFVAPEPQESEPDNSEEILQYFEQEVRSNEFTKNVLDGRRIAIKTQDGEFNYEIPSAKDMVDMTIDNDRFFRQFANESGNLDYAKWYKTVAYSQNPEMFERALINYGKTLGRSEVTKEIKNPSNAQFGDVPTEDSVDFTTGLLQAFASRGIKK